MDFRDRKPRRCFRSTQPELELLFGPYIPFVMHEHDIPLRHHYDFRFKLGKGLRDFFLPIGPSTDPTVSRKIVSYHDHDLRCLKLEHAGLMGVGGLSRWDEGLMRPICLPGVSQEEAIWDGLERGFLRFELYGFKLKGLWEMKMSGGTGLFQKVDDEFASQADVLLQNQSVYSGLTMQEIYAEAEELARLTRFIQTPGRFPKLLGNQE